MRPSLLIPTLLASFCVQTANAAVFKQIQSISGFQFYDAFHFEDIADPTHGRVDYVDSHTAMKQNLSFATHDTFIIRADSKTKLSPGGPGRRSVRLISHEQWTDVVMIFNIRHMPEGCGTWPAVWTKGDNWPFDGEIDILEGVNDQGPNLVTLHTNEGCKVPFLRIQEGTALGSDCNVATTSNNGCPVQDWNDKSFGPEFNDNGGGWYAMERSSEGIKVWFWSRATGNVPQDVASGSTTIETRGLSWGSPVAFFPDSSCDIDKHFGPQNILINLSFCGDFAGTHYDESGCPSNCVDFVNSNPSAFKNAYFDFAWLKIYA